VFSTYATFSPYSFLKASTTVVTCSCVNTSSKRAAIWFESLPPTATVAGGIPASSMTDVAFSWSIEVGSVTSRAVPALKSIS